MERMEILPYQFEPIKSQQSDFSGSETDNSSGDETGNDSSDADGVNVNRLGNTDWCSCGCCEAMPTGTESVCCQDSSQVHLKAEDEDVKCITQHSGFDAVCINRDSLEVSVFEFVRMEGPIDDADPIHELYRYLAYRRFTRWIWHILGKKNRKVIPACAVCKIRKAFPSEHYTGFKYARF